MADIRQEILRTVNYSFGISAYRISGRLNVPRPIVSRHLQALRRKGLVEHAGAWLATDEGRAALRAQEEG